MREEVVAELKAMKAVGMRVPKTAFAIAESYDYVDAGAASASEMADLIVSLA